MYTYSSKYLFFTVPFIIDALNKGLPVDSGSSPYESNVENDGETSKKNGIMLALFSAGLLVGTPIFGYVGTSIYYSPLNVFFFLLKTLTMKHFK